MYGFLCIKTGKDKGCLTRMCRHFFCPERGDMSIFKDVKDSVTARMAAEYYGMKPTRSGMIRCPFHADRTPSCKVDRRYHCFGCGADGDAIDFVADLYGLSLIEAARKLTEDFSIRQGSRGTGSKEPSVRKRIDGFRNQVQKDDEKKCLHDLLAYRRQLDVWEKEYAPGKPEERWHPKYETALMRKSYMDYLIEIMLDGEGEDKSKVISAWKGGQIFGKDVGRTGQALA